MTDREPAEVVSASDRPFRPAADNVASANAVALRVLASLAPDQCDDVSWEFNARGVITMTVGCTDVFMPVGEPGGARGWDQEEVTVDTIDLFEATYAECRAIFADVDRMPWADQLFVARARGLRPMSQVYAGIDDDRWRALFDASGPARVIGPDNPVAEAEARARREQDARRRRAVRERIAEQDAQEG